MRNLLISLTIALTLIGGSVFPGGPVDHAIQAFPNFNKPIELITNYDRFNAIVDHAKTDGLIAENGRNLILYQSFFGYIALQKAKSINMARQFRMAAMWGNIPDMLDKGLTGGAIEYQLLQVPLIGEILAIMVPHALNQELLHSIGGWPRPSYSMTEEQYFWFQVIETTIFWFQLDAVSVKNNAIVYEFLF